MSKKSNSDANSEGLISFVQSVLHKLAYNIPEKTFHQVCETLTQELKYQQIQDKRYRPWQNSLNRIDETYEMQQKLVRRMDTLLASSTQSELRDDRQLGALDNILKNLGENPPKKSSSTEKSESSNESSMDSSLLEAIERLGEELKEQMEKTSSSSPLEAIEKLGNELKEQMEKTSSSSSDSPSLEKSSPSLDELLEKVEEVLSQRGKSLEETWEEQGKKWKSDLEESWQLSNMTWEEKYTEFVKKLEDLSTNSSSEKEDKNSSEAVIVAIEENRKKIQEDLKALSEEKQEAPWESLSQTLDDKFSARFSQLEEKMEQMEETVLEHWEKWDALLPKLENLSTVIEQIKSSSDSKKESEESTSES